MRAMLAISLAVLVACAEPAAAQPREGGMVVADHPAATRIGANVLRRGGNAIDAAVATSFALSICRPYSCGIGGGGFMVIWIADSQKAVVIDYRETAPAAATPDMFVDLPEGASRRGGAAGAVPGTVAGLLEAHERYGRMYLFEILAEVTLLGEQGFLVDAHYESTARAVSERFKANPEWKQLYPYLWKDLLLEGNARVGDRIFNPRQAELIKRIGRRGAREFYSGDVAEAIASAVQDAGGIITVDDIGNYAGSIAEPIHTAVAGFDVWTMPPPSSGGIALAQILQLMDRIEARSLWSEFGDVHWTHALAESFRHAFADRSRYLADPRFTPVPTAELLSPASLDRLAAKITRDAVMPIGDVGTRLEAPDASIPEDGGTSHISVVDRFGNAVACTETINLAFGSFVAVDEFGFLLNNEMDDFTARPGEPNAFGLVQSARNAPEPGKRPLSSMTPTIVTRDGEVVAVVGASGGPRIITSVAQALLRILSGQPVAKAVAAARIHHQFQPDRIEVESDDNALHAALVELGHTVKSPVDRTGVVQAIARIREGLTGAADPRKGGTHEFVPASETVDTPQRPRRRTRGR